jgi:hypothetical protein
MDELYKVRAFDYGMGIVLLDSRALGAAGLDSESETDPPFVDLIGIVDLRPGAYSITFTLTGFSTVRREGLELTGSGTITVNAELKVGSLEETVTVQPDLKPHQHNLAHADVGARGARCQDWIHVRFLNGLQAPGFRLQARPEPGAQSPKPKSECMYCAQGRFW